MAPCGSSSLKKAGVAQFYDVKGILRIRPVPKLALGRLQKLPDLISGISANPASGPFSERKKGRRGLARKAQTNLASKKPEDFDRR